MAEWYDGETFDATIDLNKKEWKEADITKAKGNPKLLAQYGAPVRRIETLHSAFLHRTECGELIYDFKQNFSGVIHVKIKGKNGQRIIFRHAEVLVDDKLFVKPLRTAKATATYICIDGEQEYSPKFTYMGFRYVGVTGIEPEHLELSAHVLHSDIPEIGSFACSNELLNRLQENIRWGAKSNFVDIPTDCPQRDERQGWTGDIAVFASTASFMFDTSRFFEKWLLDVRSEQALLGGIPMVVPRAGDPWPVLPTACWGDSCILVPWAEYLARGNRELLQKQYKTIKRFLRAAKFWSIRYIWRFPFQFGDWCAPEGYVTQWMAKGKWIATAYFANSCEIASKIAEILGYSNDVIYFKKLRGKIVNAYRRKFTDGAGKLKNEFQSAYLLPLHFKMTEGKETKKMVQNLINLIQKADNHLTTGFPGTPYILFALSDYGALKEAYDLLLQESCPSWLYQVIAGGTTLWERWDTIRRDGIVNTGANHSEEDASVGMGSLNHYAVGAVGDWLYRRMAGIEPIEGGYKVFKIAPKPGGGITWVKGSHRCPYGEIKSEWNIEGEEFELQIRVPFGTIALVILPDGTEHKVEGGEYHFTIAL